jgi:hypothetical protein
MFRVVLLCRLQAVLVTEQENKIGKSLFMESSERSGKETATGEGRNTIDYNIIFWQRKATTKISSGILRGTPATARTQDAQAADLLSVMATERG